MHLLRATTRRRFAEHMFSGFLRNSTRYLVEMLLYTIGLVMLRKQVRATLPESATMDSDSPAKGHQIN